MLIAKWSPVASKLLKLASKSLKLESVSVNSEESAKVFDVFSIFLFFARKSPLPAKSPILLEISPSLSLQDTLKMLMLVLGYYSH